MGICGDSYAMRAGMKARGCMMPGTHKGSDGLRDRGLREASSKQAPAKQRCALPRSSASSDQKKNLFRNDKSAFVRMETTAARS